MPRADLHRTRIDRNRQIEIRMKARIKEAILKGLPAWMAFCLSSAYSFTRQRLLSDALSTFKPEFPVAGEAVEFARAIERDGFVVLPKFRSVEWCSAMRVELMAAMDDRTRNTLHAEDTRVFGIENISERGAS